MSYNQREHAYHMIFLLQNDLNTFQYDNNENTETIFFSILLKKNERRKSKSMCLEFRFLEEEFHFYFLIFTLKK